MRIPTLVLALLAALTSVARAQHDMHGGGRPTASGTSWLPDSSPTRMVHRDFGAWSMMLHGSAFALNDQQTTLHGGAQWGLIDWEMASASRDVAGGTLRVNGMTSLESLVLPDSGYHELLQTGEVFRGRRRADVQHPHRLLMELSSAYEHSLTNALSASVYAGLVGEPALGPVAYMHRPSADMDPFAPIGHHWQDASHESVGVVTAGFFSRMVKVEGSVFNARESVESHLDAELRRTRLDSYAGRITVLPTGRAALSAWAGYLADHDPLSPGLGMQRYGASMLTEMPAPRGTSLSSAVIWGMNVHHHSERLHVHDSTSNHRLSHPSSAVLLETTWRLGDRTAIYGRAEQAQKTGDDFGFLGGDLAQLFTVRALSLGATRQVVRTPALTLGIGARAALNLFPATLVPTYQTRHAAGYVVYLTLQPAAAHGMAAAGTSLGQMDSSR